MPKKEQTGIMMPKKEHKNNRVPYYRETNLKDLRGRSNCSQRTGGVQLFLSLAGEGVVLEH